VVRKARAILAAVVEGLDRVVSLVVILAMAVLTVVIFLQVVMRYGFNSSLDWGWEVPRLCFIATIFLALPLGLKTGAHVAIAFLVGRVGDRSRVALVVLQSALSILLMGIVAAFGLWLTVDLWDQTMPTLNLSIGVFYAMVTFSAVHSILHLLNGALMATAQVLIE
jgi:TRAP-type C4-dicarboxylate transport system permease small subunit